MWYKPGRHLFLCVCLLHLTISSQDLPQNLVSILVFNVFTAAERLLARTIACLTVPPWVDIWVVSNLAFTKDATKNNLVLTSFCTCASVCLKDKFPEGQLLGQKVCTFLILTDIAKWSSVGAVPVSAPTGTARDPTSGEGVGSTDEWSRDLGDENILLDKWEREG